MIEGGISSSLALDAPEVRAKKEAAVRWCKRASDFSQTHGGKPWKYLLIPQDAIADNMTLAWLAGQFAIL
jgi:type III restriction enzyme